jgi:hypothetical protein
MSAPTVDADPALGEPIANYPSDRGHALLIAGTISGAAAVFLNFTLAALPEWWAPALTVILMAGLCLALGWYVLHIWNREIILYEHGFTYREGANLVPFFYQELRGVRLRAERLAYFGGLVRRRRYTFTVITKQGETFTITDLLYRRAAELGTRLTEHLNRTLQPSIAARLQQGEAIPFSDTLRLRNEGLQDDERLLSWADYGGCRVGGRQLALLNRVGEVWYSAPLSEIENITLLLDVLREREKERLRTE